MIIRDLIINGPIVKSMENSRLVHFKSSYNNDSGENAGGFNTIVIIDLYKNKRFTYQRFTQAFKSPDRKNQGKEIRSMGIWIVTKKRGKQILILNFSGGGETIYSLSMETPHEVYLDNDKYIRMKLSEKTRG